LQQLVKSHPLYATGRVTAFVADLARDALATPRGPIPAHTVDAATLVFVLSALPPAAMPAAVAAIAATLKRPSADGTTDGGRVLFRDYAAGDLAEARFASAAAGKRIGGGSGGGDNGGGLYVRGDGTLCYYFDPVRGAGGV
jgi:methyltransferase-like protein 6